MTTDGNRIAGPGHVFVCAACGKRSKDLYGDEKVDPGWDESCMLNACLCYEDSLEFHPNGLVIGAKVVEGWSRGPRRSLREQIEDWDVRKEGPS